ncbi:hypothetical protein GYMLUDRAFT_240496 [Collybiopsis luxurians FD-317 M1]|nr:hypothetical protein GYMLUDRAFT_240496 [Collybiopsis luxurians FD-317 M1]
MELTEGREKEWKHIMLTPIKETKDGTNNYSEFKCKSTLELDATDYWKYINRPDYNPLLIPDLCPSHEVQGFDVAGLLMTVTISGNEDEVLVIIVKAVPVAKLYLIEDCTSAHAAWKALQNEYEPNNTLSALTIMQQIIGNQCQPSDNPVAWLQVMIQLHSHLHAADPNMMSDWDFVKHLITLMSKDEKWRYCRDRLRDQLRVTKVAGHPFLSAAVIRHLKDEEIELGIAPSVAPIKAIIATGKSRSTVTRGDDCVIPGVYSANDFSGNTVTSTSRQQGHNDRGYKPYSPNDNQ